MSDLNNVTGSLTLNLITFLREMQAWYQGRGNHIASCPEDHSVGSALVRFADPCTSIGSIRLANVPEAHRFSRKHSLPLIHLVAMVEGEYLGFLAHEESGWIIAGGVTHLVRDGKTMLRVDGQDEKVFSYLNLHAMNSAFVTLSALMAGLAEERRHRFPSQHTDVECFADLGDELTLQTYATVRRGTTMNPRPIMVCHALEAIHQLTTTKKLAACLVPVNPFEARIAAFLLGHEVELTKQPLMHLLTRYDARLHLGTIDSRMLRHMTDEGPSQILIAGSSPQVARELSGVVEQNGRTILARADRLPV